jgi:hypothetical protein
MIWAAGLFAVGTFLALAWPNFWAAVLCAALTLGFFLGWIWP